MNLLLIGAQGSGKGTQSQLLAQDMRLVPCASGDLLREEIAKGTPNGLAARPYYDNGDLVPDKIIVSMILERMTQIERQAGAPGIILDGFPRTTAQAEALDRALAERHEELKRVIYLDVPREQLLARVADRYVCRAAGHVYNLKTNPPRVPGICDIDGSELYLRSDDAAVEKVKHRLDIFFTETIQLLDYYARQGKLVHVDGTQSIEAVHRDILAALQVSVAAESQVSDRDGDPVS